MNPGRFVAVLDACVLYPLLLRDTLLTLAEDEFFTPKWSQQIEDEWVRNVRAKGIARGDDPAALDKALQNTRACMNDAFMDACVPPQQIVLPALNGLVPPDDQHVVATAIACRADAIVTANLKHFPDDALSHYGLEAIHPDDFFMDLVDFDQVRAVKALSRMIGRYTRPPKTSAELAEAFVRVQLLQAAEWLRGETVSQLLDRR